MHDGVERLARMPVAVDDAVHEAFEARVADSSSLAFRVAYSVLRRRDAAEDIAQEALIRAYRRAGQLRDRTRFRAWLVRMTWRLALDEQRAAGRRTARNGEASRRSAEPSELEAGRRDEVWDAIDRLPRRLREPLVLASIEGHTMDEVAALLGTPVGTVKSRLFEARALLKEWLS